MFNTLSVAEQGRKHPTTQAALENHEVIRVIPVVKLQSELCAVMNLTSDLRTPFSVSNRGIITNAIIPATVFDIPRIRHINDQLPLIEHYLTGLTIHLAYYPFWHENPLVMHFFSIIGMMSRYNHRRFQIHYTNFGWCM